MCDERIQGDLAKIKGELIDVKKALRLLIDRLKNRNILRDPRIKFPLPPMPESRPD